MVGSSAAPSPPPVRDSLLTRAEQLGVLPLALVVAPAGSGKSTLLAAWRRRIAERGDATAFVDLSPLHADAAVLRQVIRDGVPGTSMPGFGITAGGTLTDAQIDILVEQMRARWGGSAGLESSPPPYRPPATGAPPSPCGNSTST
mgnify:CR=1 FL=1